jgi:glyoxylase-like metal-dependent hydrolase (beta-lactamase superfamily II)
MEAGKVDRVANGVRRILAPNPSAMTGPGTNTYLIGEGPDVLLLDPGPDVGSHLAAVLAALGPDEAVAGIIVTHAHRDHSEAAPRLAAATGAPVLAFGRATDGRSAAMQRLAEAGLVSGGEGVDTGFAPDRLLADGETLPSGSGNLRVLHTPGHMGGHICLGFGDILFSGDHAMGWSTSLVSPPDGDMRDYMASLDRLQQQRWSLMLPGHGEAVMAVADRLEALARHRRQREAEILTALETRPLTLSMLTRKIYADLPRALLPAARRNTLAHVIDLAERKEITGDDFLSDRAIFTRTPNP